MARTSGIRIKKKFGQHFLRDYNVVYAMLSAVELSSDTSVFEIGCGDGFLTRVILQQPIARLWVFEIDPQWAEFVQEKLGSDERLKVFQQDFLTLDFEKLEPFKPWTVLANLPYQVTFPILHRLKEHRHMLKEGVVMVQEEVAQKITKTSGRGYGFVSLFYQYYFDWKLLVKIPPSAFYPPPKVFSRLLYFKPKLDVQPIPQEDEFWKFIKMCFKQPRRTLRNNLLQAHYDITKIPDQLLSLRAQQMSMKDFLALWDHVNTQ